MKIETHTPRLRQIRKVAVELILASHKVAEGKSKYRFIEVMTCPGGCVKVGGQPIDFNTSHKSHRLLYITYAKRENFN